MDITELPTDRRTQVYAWMPVKHSPTDVAGTTLRLKRHKTVSRNSSGPGKSIPLYVKYIGFFQAG